MNKLTWISLFLVIYTIPLIELSQYYTPNVFFLSRVIGLIALLNVFTQAIIGLYRPYLSKTFKASNVFKFHNYLGFFTLLLVYAHVLLIGFNFKLINALIAFIIMNLTVITSDLKYFFKVKIETKTWHYIHLLNYTLLPILYIHWFALGVTIRASIYLISALLAFTLLSGLKKLWSVKWKRKS